MGERATKYFQSTFDFREVAIEWLAKDKWTVREAAALLTGFDPRVRDLHNWWYEIDGHRHDEIYNSITEYLQNEATRRETGGALFVYMYGEGAKIMRENWDFPIEKATFSPGAFLAFALRKIIYLDGMAADAPCFGLFHDEEAEVKGVRATEGDATQLEAIDDDFLSALRKLKIDDETSFLLTMYLPSGPIFKSTINGQHLEDSPVEDSPVKTDEVAPGISLSALKGLLNEESPEYRRAIAVMIKRALEVDNSCDEGCGMQTYSIDFNALFGGRKSDLEWILPCLEELSTRPPERRTHEAIVNSIRQRYKRVAKKEMNQSKRSAINSIVMPAGTGGAGNRNTLKV